MPGSQVTRCSFEEVGGIVELGGRRTRRKEKEEAGRERATFVRSLRHEPEMDLRYQKLAALSTA